VFKCTKPAHAKPAYAMPKRNSGSDRWAMKSYFLPVAILAMICSSCARRVASGEPDSFQMIQSAVVRLLHYPSYSAADERTLNHAGDMAALAVIRNVAVEEMKSPEKERQILLVLSLAFEAPQMIANDMDRRPTAALLLLDHLQATNYGGQKVNQIENVRNEVRHNTSTGKPFEFVTLAGEPPIDWEHTQWVTTVLGWAGEVKPGMTRKELLRVYTEEGGISTRTNRTYALKGCPEIKVDVEFSGVGPATEPGGESFDDRIVKISKPYLDYGRVD
jgi:hypothetical protein